jgi:integrase/recombinase XerD
MVQRFKVACSGSARVLTPEQITAMFAELVQPHQLIAQLCYYTAARIGEVTLLQRSDIDLAARAIVYRAGNTKTGDSRTAYICDQLQTALAAAHLPIGGPIFPRPRACGRRCADGSQRATISRQGVDQAFREAFERLGITRASTHSFRRSMATHLSREGLTLADIAQITGHRDLAALSHYLDPDSERAIAALARVSRRIGGLSGE